MSDYIANYASDFEVFLNNTDEKKVLLDYFSELINQDRVKSMLDIGAGNGLLSIPLSLRVEEYLAIEPNPKFSKTLRKNDIEVIDKSFPCSVDKSFDIVLSCHSIPHNISSATEFVQAAWQLVSPGGKLIIITYRSDEEDDWTKLMNCLGENWLGTNTSSYRSLIELLSSLGKVKVEKITSFVSSADLSVMIKALSFVYSDGKPELRDKFLEKEEILKKVLINDYFDGHEYTFPFQHFYLDVKR